jgi:hypothetical protein
MGPQLNLNDIGRNCLLGNRKKIAKFLMRTFTCRSTFLYGTIYGGLGTGVVIQAHQATKVGGINSWDKNTFSVHIGLKN